MKTPFKFGNIVTERYFVNRSNEIKRLQNNFNNGINTVLISPRRWGKSSLVRQAVKMFKKKTFRFVFIDLFSIRSEEEFYQCYAREVIKASLSKKDEILNAGKEFFKTIIPNFTFSVDPEIDLKVHFDWSQVQKAKDEIINLPEVIAKKRKLHIIICIDEFQNLARFKDYQKIEMLLRSCWQLHEHTTYCLYGSKRHMMLDIFNSESRAFYRFGDLILLGKIEREHWVNFITEAFRNTNKYISDEMAGGIADMVQNNPYYVQQLSYNVWLNTEHETSKFIIEQSINHMTDSNAILYQETCENLSNTQINLLKAIADGENKLTSIETMQNFKLGTPRNVTKNKVRLGDKDLIDFHAKQPYFMDPIFELWFKRNFLK